MPLSNETLYTMMGRVRNTKPNAKAEQIRTWINDAIRDVINTRTYWADLNVRGIISIPAAYATGVIGTQTGSNLVLGGGTTFFPISDVVNTSLTDDVTETGYFEVPLGNMQNVQEDGVLLVDAGSPSQEAVPILRVTATTFTGKFQFTHNAGAPVTESSLTGLQFRAGYNYPIFTVLAVIDQNTLLLDNQWGGPPLNAAPYQIVKMYVTISSKLRKMLDAVDQEQGWPLDLTTYTWQLLNSIDPQRSDTSDPRTLVPYSPSYAGNQQWEIWPASATPRQIAILYTKQWPELVDPTDIPPNFLEPTIFTNLAASTALATKLTAKDEWYDPRAADRLEKMAAGQLTSAMNNDEDRQVRDYQNLRNSLFPGTSYNWLQNHPYGADWGFGINSF
jgi:hypothetical protein